MADLLVLPRPAKSVHNGAGFSGKTGTYWACRKGKSDLSATERADGKDTGAAFAKKKRNGAVCLEYRIARGERVKMGESRTVTREREIRAGAWSGKGGLHGEGRFQGGKGGRARRASLEEVEGSTSG